MNVSRSSSKRKERSDENENEKCVTIRMDDGAEFEVSREILIRCSDYFGKRFLYDISDDILVSGISGEVMKLVLDFMKGKTVILKSENVIDLLNAADFLMVSDFLQKIRVSLADLLCNENCIQLYNVALRLDHLDIKKIVHLYVLINFPSVVANSDIGDLSFKHFQELVSDNSLKIHNEEIVFDAIVKWVETDTKARYVVVPALLSCIRLETCNEFLMQRIMNHQILQGNAFCNGIAVPNRLRRRKKFRNDQRSEFIAKVKALSPNTVCLGPRRLYHVYCHVDYDLYADGRGRGQIKLSVGMSEDDSNAYIIAVIRNFIPKFVFIRGSRFYAFAVTERLLAYDLITGDHISVLPPPPYPFMRVFENVSYCYANDDVYAFKREITGSPCVISCSVFNLQANHWLQKKSYHLPARAKWITDLSVAGLQNSVYVVVSFSVDFGLFDALALVYDTKKDSWSKFKKPPCEFNISYYFDMTSYCDVVYLVQSSTLFVYRFDPKEKTWKNFQDLPFAFIQARAIVRGGALVVYGTSEVQHPDVIYWDEEVQQWKPFGSHSVIKCDVDDERVLRERRNQYLNREWAALKKETRSIPPTSRVAAT